MNQKITVFVSFALMLVGGPVSAQVPQLFVTAERCMACHNGLVTQAGDDIAVHGAAGTDGDFVGGRDRVTYAVDVAGAKGPFVVAAELWYQPVGFRWARNLGDQEAEEIERSIGYYEETADRSGVVLASATEVVD